MTDVQPDSPDEPIETSEDEAERDEVWNFVDLDFENLDDIDLLGGP
ncbi:MAG TPA: hypothetical protein VEW93_11075 [Acidimicrobiales bacterium]|nr:hypothetical protein [Acidimicrobiales bacterium]